MRGRPLRCVLSVCAAIAAGGAPAIEAQDESSLTRAAPDSPSARSLSLGGSVDGEVTEHSEVVHTARLNADHGDAPVRGERYELTVAEAGPATLDLRSYFFDAYLVLLDAEGRVIREDDDGLLGTHSRIVVESLDPGGTPSSPAHCMAGPAPSSCPRARVRRRRQPDPRQ